MHAALCGCELVCVGVDDGLGLGGQLLDLMLCQERCGMKEGQSVTDSDDTQHVNEAEFCLCWATKQPHTLWL